MTTITSQYINSTCVPENAQTGTSNIYLARVARALVHEQQITAPLCVHIKIYTIFVIPFAAIITCDHRSHSVINSSTHTVYMFLN